MSTSHLFVFLTSVLLSSQVIGQEDINENLTKIFFGIPVDQTAQESYEMAVNNEYLKILHVEQDSSQHQYMQWWAKLKGKHFLNASADSVVYQHMTAKHQLSEGIYVYNRSHLVFHYSSKKAARKDYAKLSEQLIALFPSLKSGACISISRRDNGSRNYKRSALPKRKACQYFFRDKAKEDGLLSITFFDRRNERYTVGIDANR